MGRAGQALLWVGGVVVALVMAYTLLLDLGLGWRFSGRSEGDEALTIGVFYPERILWQELCQGIRLCADRRLVDVEDEKDDRVTVRLPRTGRRLHFVLRDVRGVRETTEEVGHFLDAAPRTLALVGSSNTVLTVALATALRDRESPSGPLLLVPWASTVQTERAGRGEGPVSLLDILPGRTFRFCLNNQYQADLLVDYLLRAQQQPSPRRVILIEDRLDPYSVDLTACFHRAIERVAPSAEIVERTDPLLVPVPSDPTALPTPSEDALADSIWRQVDALPDGEATWLFLPLQEEPARRLLVALKKQPRRGLKGSDGRLVVVSGDAITMPTLAQLAGRVPFRVHCVSSMARRSPAKGVSPDALVPAEIVAALAACIDREGDAVDSPETLRAALARLRLGPTDSAALGRSLAFSRSGERVGDDLGMVLSARPDSTDVYWSMREMSGRWLPAEAVPPDTLANWP